MLKERELQIDMKKCVNQMRQTDEAEVRHHYEDVQNEVNKAEKEKLEKKAKYAILWSSVLLWSNLTYL